MTFRNKQNCPNERMNCLVLNSKLRYKFMSRRAQFNGSVSSVLHNDHREYYRSFSWPIDNFIYTFFLEQCTLNSKAVGLYKRPCLHLLRVCSALILVHSDYQSGLLQHLDTNLLTDEWDLAGVTLKSDPIEKWLPGSFFNAKNDSPGHFSTLKVDTVPILMLNFEPKVVKKWLHPWNFDL